MLTHENLQAMISNVQYYTDDLKKPNVLQHCHRSHENALFEILFALTNGGTLILAAGQDDPATISILMQQENINFTLASSSRYSAWFRSSFQVLKTCSKRKSAFCSGCNISTTLAKRFSNFEMDELKLMSVHGISTCPVTACVGIVGFKKFAALSADSTMPAGIAAPNYSLYISGTLGRCFPSFWKGEVVLGGPGACAGFFGPTANVHGCRVYEGNGERIICTGDTGNLDDGGQLTIVSCSEDASVVRLPEGFVELDDVARTIVDQSNGKTADAAVTYNRDDKLQLHAFLVWFSKPDMNISTDLQGPFQELPLLAYLRPTSAMLLDALPLKRGGGVDRKQLQSYVVTEHDQIVLAQPRSSSRPGIGRPRQTSLSLCEQKIFEIWKKCMSNIPDATKVTATGDFFALGVDTKVLSNVLDQMRIDFRGALTLSDLARNPTIQGMATIATEQLSNIKTAHNNIDVFTDTVLPIIDRKGFGNEESNKTGENLNVLLTGATGHLGHVILSHLVDCDKVTLIHCVAIRSPDRTTQHPKVIYHAGDVTKHYFGMSETIWQQLGSAVDVIIHAAAVLDVIRRYTSLRSTNILPTENIIQLAAPQKIPIHYISAADVSQIVGYSIFPAAAVGSYKPDPNTDGYTASKWASEVILQRAHAKHEIPVMIHRPTTLVSEGAPQHNIMANLLHYSKDLCAIPELPAGTGGFDFVPVDTAARSIVRDVIQPMSIREDGYMPLDISHICSEHSIHVDELHAALAEQMGADLRTVSLREWIEAASQIGPSKDMVHRFEEFEQHVSRFVFLKIMRNRPLG